MSLTLLVITLCSAIVDWYAVAKSNRLLEFIFKPLTMILLIAWLWQNSGLRGQILWFAIALAFSLLGDVLLMLSAKLFVPGLVAFLLAHLAYLAGLNPSPPPLNMASLLLLAIIVLAGAQIYRRIASGLKAKNLPRLRGPVLAYSIVISLMLVSALITLVRPEWLPVSSLAVSAGALLFFISDTCLAWNKFVAPLRFGRVPQMIIYHLGQILLILGAVLQFVK